MIKEKDDTMNILIVEDEQAISALIRINLTRVGYVCTCAMDGEEAANLIEQQPFDLVLLDIMLPKVNGYELMEYIEPMHIPVIFITAKGSVKDRVLGLQMGADDYLVKPFAIEELLARVECVLRRYHKGLERLSVLDVSVHTNTHKVLQNEREVTLTNKEYELLLFLIQNKNIALYRDTLYEKLWGDSDHEGKRTLDLHIQRLRKKLDWHDVIKTVFKIGYMLEVTE